MSDPVVYQIKVPVLYKDDVVESVKETAGKATDTAGYTLTGTIDKSATSEIQFDPFTIAAGLWVGHLVINTVGAMAVEEVARALLKKLRERNGKGKAPKGSPLKVVFVLPDTSTVEIDVDDPDAKAKLAKLAPPKP
jgi:hypothetical protein